MQTRHGHDCLTLNGWRRLNSCIIRKANSTVAIKHFRRKGRDHRAAREACALAPKPLIANGGPLFIEGSSSGGISLKLFLLSVPIK